MVVDSDLDDGSNSGVSSLLTLVFSSFFSRSILHTDHACRNSIGFSYAQSSFCTRVIVRSERGIPSGVYLTHDWLGGMELCRNSRAWWTFQSWLWESSTACGISSPKMNMMAMMMFDHHFNPLCGLHWTRLMKSDRADTHHRLKNRYQNRTGRLSRSLSCAPNGSIQHHVYEKRNRPWSR